MPREGRILVGKAELYYREIGEGPPILVLHGGPDFDHTYLLPDLDRLADSYRLIYYDQRGRGRSAAGVEADDITMASEMRDLEAVRAHFHLESAAVLGHSFGAILAMESAIRDPARVSHLLLVNPAPASAQDFQRLRAERVRRWPADVAQLKAMRSTPAYQQGDPDAVAAYYRVHFRGTIPRLEDLDGVITVLRAGFTREGILLARRIEDRLVRETWSAEGYDLLPRLRALRIPTLVLRGEADFIPDEVARHIAQAIPHARYVSASDCGHFAYLEAPLAFRTAVDDLLGPPAAPTTGSPNPTR